MHPKSHFVCFGSPSFSSFYFHLLCVVTVPSADLLARWSFDWSLKHAWVIWLVNQRSWKRPIIWLSFPLFLSPMINYLSGVSLEFVSLHYRLQISYLFIWKYQLKLWNKICMYLSLFCVTCFLVFLRLELGFIFVFPQFCMKLESLFFNIFSFLSHRWSNLVSHSWYFVLSQWKPPWYCIRTGANSYCNSRYPISLLFNVVRQIMLYIAFPFPVPLLAPRLVCLWMCVRENVCLVSIGCLCVCVFFFFYSWITWKVTYLMKK